MAMPAALSVGASRALSSAGSSRTSFRWPFAFTHSRTAKLDWRPLSSLDLDRVERDVDLDALESHLEGIAFGALGAEEMRWLDDEAIRKLYRVMQMIIQYLLYVRLSLCTHPSTHCALCIHPFTHCAPPLNPFLPHLQNVLHVSLTHAHATF